VELTTSYIDFLAPSPEAIANGKGLVKKGNFTNLRKTPDGLLLFGECTGSGSKPYICSMDFIDAAKPVPRCTCPSRQRPCKHVMGLLYAYAQGMAFTESDVPEDILAKRENSEKRAESKAKKVESSQNEKNKKVDLPPSKARITAAAKKIDVQLEGIEIAEKLLKNITQTGLAGIDARAQQALGDQIIQLGNYRIKGIQAAFSELHLFMREDDAHYTRSIPQLIFLRALLKKAREHLATRKQDPHNILNLDISSEIEEQIDHTWKLEELRACGSYISQAEIVQLSFNVYDDPAKKELVDTGYFLCLQSGQVYVTKNYRPYKALKYINQDDSVLEPLVAETLYIYPGRMNPRVRFDKYTMRPWQSGDYAAIKQHASTDFGALAKAVKNQLKTPLADKNPVALLKIDNLTTLKDEQEFQYASAQDGKGNSQLLQGNTLPLLLMIDKKLLRGHAMLVMYENDIDSGLLTARPLSIITDDRIIRLEY